MPVKQATLAEAQKRVAWAETSVLMAKKERNAARTALGETFRRAREQRGMSLRHVAQQLGLSAPFISDCELGRRWFSPEHESAYYSLLHCPHDERDQDGCCKACGMGL